jgi:hypothetical protein
MNKFNAFLVLSMATVASIFAGVAMVTPVVAQGNSTIPMGDLVNTTMIMDNSTSMTSSNSTNSTESEEEEESEESSESGESEESSESGESEESSESGESED